MPVTTNHFPGWGISVIFDLTFLPGVGNFTAVFLKVSNLRDGRVKNRAKKSQEREEERS